MSNKINICEIIKDHIKTLSDTENKLCISDILIFFGIPALLAVISCIFSYPISADATSTLVNFGSITTALLLSVLVLVYDQDRKNEEKKDTDTFYDRKKKLFKQVYSNICYSVIISILLVAVCLLNILFGTISFTISKCVISLSTIIFTPIIFFISSNLMLTILMVTKRIYAILKL